MLKMFCFCFLFEFFFWLKHGNAKKILNFWSMSLRKECYKEKVVNNGSI